MLVTSIFSFSYNVFSFYLPKGKIVILATFNFSSVNASTLVTFKCLSFAKELTRVSSFILSFAIMELFYGLCFAISACLRSLIFFCTLRFSVFKVSKKTAYANYLLIFVNRQQFDFGGIRTNPFSRGYDCNIRYFWNYCNIRNYFWQMGPSHFSMNQTV